MDKAIKLVETREGCAIFETRSRYDVLFRGKKIGSKPRGKPKSGKKDRKGKKLPERQDR